MLDTGSKYSREGTAAHAVGSTLLTNRIWDAGFASGCRIYEL
jgi:hypothetical protein